MEATISAEELSQAIDEIFRLRGAYNPLKIVRLAIQEKNARISELEKERDELRALKTSPWKAMYDGREQAVAELREELEALRSRFESAEKAWLVGAEGCARHISNEEPTGFPVRLVRILPVEES